MKGAVRNVDRQLLFCLRIFVHSSVCVFVCVGCVFYVFFFFFQNFTSSFESAGGESGADEEGWEGGKRD